MGLPRSTSAGLLAVPLVRVILSEPFGAAATLGATGNAMVDQFARGEREGPIQMELRR